jgi:hypothetical protein
MPTDLRAHPLRTAAVAPPAGAGIGVGRTHGPGRSSSKDGGYGYVSSKTPRIGFSGGG